MRGRHGIFSDMFGASYLVVLCFLCLAGPALRYFVMRDTLMNVKKCYHKMILVGHDSHCFDAYSPTLGFEIDS